MPQSRGGSQNSEPTVRLAPHFLYTIETAIKRSIRWANKRILGFGCFEVSFSSAGLELLHPALLLCTSAVTPALSGISGAR